LVLITQTPKLITLYKTHIFMPIIVQQYATTYSLLHISKLLYIFRVVTPPITRSTNKCNYSFSHWSNRLSYLSLWWRRWNWFQPVPTYTLLQMSSGVFTKLQNAHPVQSGEFQKIIIWLTNALIQLEIEGNSFSCLRNGKFGFLMNIKLAYF